MKISQKQAELLAKEIINQLKKTKTHKVSELTKARLQEFKEKRATLIAAKDAASAALNKHDASLVNITGPLNRLYASDTIAQIINNMETAAVPTLASVMDRIILKSMFATEDDMQTFINGIIKEYTKKKPTVNQN